MLKIKQGQTGKVDRDLGSDKTIKIEKQQFAQTYN